MFGFRVKYTVEDWLNEDGDKTMTNADQGHEYNRHGQLRGVWTNVAQELFEIAQDCSRSLSTARATNASSTERIQRGSLKA